MTSTSNNLFLTSSSLALAGAVLIILFLAFSKSEMRTFIFSNHIVFSIPSLNKLGVSSEAISSIFSPAKKKNCETHLGIATSTNSCHIFSSADCNSQFFLNEISVSINVGFRLSTFSINN